jgi:hypothetical protein
VRPLRIALASWLIVALAGCAPVQPTPSLAVPLSPVVERAGEHPILSPAGVALGTVTIRRVNDVRTTIDVVLLAPDLVHPWGIYDQASCGLPPVDRDAPFQFADIENGVRSEEVETGGFLGFPGNLVLLVFTDGVGDPYGCADLGPPTLAAGAEPSAAACPDTRPTTGVRGSSELAYSRDELSNADIYRSDATGGSEVRLTSALGPDMKPSWSPSGDRIAFRTSRDRQDEIYVMNADGSCQRNLTNSPVDDRSPAWSPTGCRIAFDHFFTTGHQDIALMSPDGGPMQRLTTRSGEYPAWSPDGRQIAFASARTGDYDLYIVNANGTGEHAIARMPGYQMYPAWSPDGQWIAYETGPDSIDRLQIHVMHPDGTDHHAITNDDATNRFPAWAADGRLAWTASGNLVALDPGARDPQPIGPGQFPAWRDWSVGTPTC